SLGYFGKSILKTGIATYNKYCIFVKKLFCPLRNLLRKYKSVIRFVLLFLGTYLFFGILYSIYLKASENGAYFPDFITNLVALQSASVLETMGYSSYLWKEPQVQGMVLT